MCDLCGSGLAQSPDLLQSDLLQAAMTDLNTYMSGSTWNPTLGEWGGGVSLGLFKGLRGVILHLLVRLLVEVLRKKEIDALGIQCSRINMFSTVLRIGTICCQVSH